MDSLEIDSSVKYVVHYEGEFWDLRSYRCEMRNTNVSNPI